MSNFVGINPSLTTYYIVDLLIIIAILAGVRVFAGLVGNVSSTDELAKKNNHAFGISVAGATLSIAIMLMGAVSGEVGMNPATEALSMVAYGIAGILLMWITRKLFDAISLPNISIHDLILNENTAAAVVDAGNMIATAIIIRSVMIWVDTNSLGGIAIIAVGFVLSQVILLGATVYRRYVYNKRHGQYGVQEQISNGNTALALRFSGYRIGMALAVTAASGIAVYDPESLFTHMLAWLIIAIIFAVSLTLIAILTRFVVLPGVNVADEVDSQGNVAIGAIEAAIYIAVGFLLAGLFG